MLRWALMVFVEQRLRFFNVWVEEFLDVRGVRREVTMLADVVIYEASACGHCVDSKREGIHATF